MNSKITIEVDFSNGNNPVIQIIQRNSTDVRDQLIHYFLELLGHQSSWCKIYCEYTSPVDNPNERFQRWVISPIRPDQFEQEIGYMSEQHRLNSTIPTKNNLSL